MLQCISPHLTIDQTLFTAWTNQCQRWLDRIRYACTYHHPTILDNIKSNLPTVPLINPATSPLTPPKRDPPHTHPEFDYGWGTGPIIDSYTSFYLLAGAVPRVPGHCQAEIYDHQKEEEGLDDINKYGETNEYIHPICQYRNILRGPGENSALKEFTRKFQANPNAAKEGEGRFWWYKNGETKGLPEWVILAHKDGEVNYERTWYEMCEKTPKALETLKKAGYDKDFLEVLDSKCDFGVGDRAGYLYP